MLMYDVTTIRRTVKRQDLAERMTQKDYKR